MCGLAQGMREGRRLDRFFGEPRALFKDLLRTFCSWMFNAGVPELATIRLTGHGSSQMVRRVDALLSDQTYEAAIGCLPSVADMFQQNVIDFAIATENRAVENAKEAKNA